MPRKHSSHWSRPPGGWEGLGGTHRASSQPQGRALSLSSHLPLPVTLLLLLTLELFTHLQVRCCDPTLPLLWSPKTSRQTDPAPTEKQMQVVGGPGSCGSRATSAPWLWGGPGGWSRSPASPRGVSQDTVPPCILSPDPSGWLGLDSTMTNPRPPVRWSSVSASWGSGESQSILHFYPH